jgi:fatty acid desaturase
MTNVTAASAGSRSRSVAGEFLTLALILMTFLTWIVLTLFWHDIPLLLLVPAAAYCLTLYGSLQHEAIHGHPTRHRVLNLSLVWLPLTLWIPITVYESSHHAHHRNELTRPGVDPESWYIDADRWQQLSGPRRWLLRFNNTFAGRMLVGPWISVVSLWVTELRTLFRDFSNAPMLLGHIAGVSFVLLWVTQVAQMPIWIYLLVFMWPGISLSLVRSFVEHRYDDEPGRRTAIVTGGPLTRLVFLNNNYHLIHHRQPGLAWYRIPHVYARERVDLENAVDGFSYRGYGEIARRYFLKPWIQPVYPARAGSRGDAIRTY